MIVPFHLYKNDARFIGDNIRQIEIQDAGHIPWLEKMDVVVKTFDLLYEAGLARKN